MVTRAEKRRIEYFPLRISLIFLVFTELLFWLGPINFRIVDNLILVVYLSILNLALWFGYSFGNLVFKPSTYKFSLKTVEFLLLIGFISHLRFSIDLWNSINLPITLDSIIESIINPGEAYLKAQDNVVKSSFIDYIVFSLFRIITIPLGISVWKRLPKSFKYLVISTIFLQVVTYLSVGTRKGLFDIIIYTFFIIVASNPDVLQSRIAFKKLKKVTFWAIIVFIFYFIYSIASRYGTTLQEIQNIPMNNVRVFYKNLPPWIIISLQSVTSYLCQGYYALACALEMGIKDIVMFSDNWVSAYYCEKFLGYDPIDLTYLADLESIGIDRKVNWHTIYLWLANQYTFIGVPFVIFFIGYFFAQSWRDAVYGKNDLSYITLSFFVVMVFYMFANNQVISDSATTFLFWFMFYQVSRFH